MERFIIEKLKEWKDSKYRQPLFLSGARKVGKTYILKQFGEENYEGVAYFNFDHDEDLYNLFENTNITYFISSWKSRIYEYASNDI